MATQDLFRVTIAFTDPDSDDREAEALKLLPQLKEMVESVDRVATVTPEGGKGLGFLPGWLTTQVNLENGKQLLGFLGNRLAGKSIELEVEGTPVKVTACTTVDIQGFERSSPNLDDSELA